jgi:hypothetical protein
VGLEWGPHSLVSTTEAILERKSSGQDPEIRDYGRKIRRAYYATPLCPQKLALISPTCCGRSVGIVRLRTKTTELLLLLLLFLLLLLLLLMFFLMIYVIPYRSTVLNDLFLLTGMKHCLSLQACLKTGCRGDYLELRSDKQHEDGIELRSNELHNTCSSPEITMVTISRLLSWM